MYTVTRTTYLETTKLSLRILSQINRLTAYNLLFPDIFHFDRRFPFNLGPFLPLPFILDTSL
jgi:hypothetical protein